MSKPTPLSPWFVVLLYEDDGTISGDYKPPQWYRESETGEALWTTEPREARVFNSFPTAWRVAQACGAYCVAIGDEQGFKEWRPQ